MFLFSSIYPALFYSALPTIRCSLSCFFLLLLRGTSAYFVAVSYLLFSCVLFLPCVLFPLVSSFLFYPLSLLYPLSSYSLFPLISPSSLISFPHLISSSPLLPSPCLLLPVPLAYRHNIKALKRKLFTCAGNTNLHRELPTASKKYLPT